MKISQLLKLSIKELSASTSPLLDAEVLLAYALGITKETLYRYPDRELSDDEESRFNKYVARRTKGEPVAYITGHKEFFGLDFLVDKRVLIPRPETEMLVELGLDEITNDQLPMTNKLLIDVGTGSGAIAIAIATQCRMQNVECRMFATDISKDALEVAKENAKRLGVSDRIKFLHGNLLEPVFNSTFYTLHSSLLITANLPYLTEMQWSHSPSIQYEPKQALVADNAGLACYETLLDQLKIFFEKSTVQLTLLCEMDPSQSDALSSLMRARFPGSTIQIYKDLALRDRVIVMKQNGSSVSGL